MGTERSLKEKSFECSLRQELKLHINERLYRQGIISMNRQRFDWYPKIRTRDWQKKLRNFSQ